MNSKAFMLLLVGVLVLGGSIGGAFAGGVVVGKNQEAEAAPSSLPTQLPAGSGQQFTDQFSQEQLDQFRQQFQGEFGQGAGGRGGFDGGFGGRGGLSGTIESIEGNILTINTLQGPLLATIGSDTVIQQFAQGTLADLQTGTRVTVTGERGEDGTFEANSILLTPEGTEGFFGGGGRRQLDQQAP